MKFFCKSLSIIILIPLVLAALSVKADYYEKLEKVEANVRNNLVLTSQKIEELEKHKDKFTVEEKHLYSVTKAHIEILKSNFESAKELLKGVLSSEAGPNYKARAHSLLASINSATGEYDETYYHLDWSIKLLDQVDKEHYKVTILSNALNNYNDLEMTSFAMDYAVRLLRYGERTDNQFAICLAKVEITLIEIQSNEVILASERLTETKDACSEVNIGLIKLSIALIEAKIALLKDDYKMAKKVLEEYYPIVKEFGWGTFTSIVEVNLAETYYHFEEYKSAMALAKLALERAEAVNDVKRKKKAVKVLALIETKLGNEKEAIEYYKKFIEYEKELYTSVRQRKLSYSKALSRIKMEEGEKNNSR